MRGGEGRGGEEEEEEEELVPRTVGLCFVPPGSHADKGRESSVLPPPEQDDT